MPLSSTSIWCHVSRHHYNAVSVDPIFSARGLRAALRQLVTAGAGVDACSHRCGHPVSLEAVLMISDNRTAASEVYPRASQYDPTPQQARQWCLVSALTTVMQHWRTSLWPRSHCSRHQQICMLNVPRPVARLFIVDTSTFRIANQQAVTEGMFRRGRGYQLRLVHVRLRCSDVHAYYRGCTAHQHMTRKFVLQLPGQSKPRRSAAE